jgi:hypothetical protein
LPVNGTKVSVPMVYESQARGDDLNREISAKGSVFGMVCRRQGTVSAMQATPARGERPTFFRKAKDGG